VDESGQHGGPAHERELARLLANDNRGGMVKYFMKDMVGAPAPMVVMMRLMPWVWRQLEAVAHTLPYDAALMTQFRIPRARFVSIQTPVLVMNGAKTDPRLREAARSLAGVIPGAHYRELAGQTHNVKPGVLAPAAVEFLEP
jgi:pimeloyl-ACP methyl ester carboxylesterase